MASTNEWQGPPAFRALNAQMRDYVKAQKGKK
jgi:hypothetical protein